MSVKGSAEFGEKISVGGGGGVLRRFRQDEGKMFMAEGAL